ncbi:MAG TPA: sulfate adenylyltransferase, partial [Chitinophagales bacterium]|nr:sulfate adenylyltransferase [Chitinophagales bacterium]
IASLLQIPHVVICINKMDLVDFSQEKYEEVVEQFRHFASKLDVQDVRFIPISALLGDNVVDRSKNMPWYEGPTLMYTLETVHIGSDHNLIDCRFPVQYVVRPMSNEYHDYRGYAGRVAGGVLKPGDEVMHLPSGITTKIAEIKSLDGDLEEAYPPQSVTLILEDDVDISRGDMLVRENNAPKTGQDIDIMLCWMDDKKSLQLNGKYAIKHTTRDARCVVKEILYKVDVNTLHRIQDVDSLALNEIGRVKIRTTVPLFYDEYRRNRNTGSIIIIDEATNTTVGAGMIIE